MAKSRVDVGLFRLPRCLRLGWWLGLCSLLLVCFPGPLLAGPLADRLAAFPHWQGKPPVQVAGDDLAYPAWLAGTWDVSSTLVDLVAPLAPDLVTPGFESNRAYLGQPVNFTVRFVAKLNPPTAAVGVPQGSLKAGTLPKIVVADRAFNGLNIARAYLGDRQVLSVQVDPLNVNRQVTRLRDDRQFISLVTGRLGEAPTPDRFITTEVFQQVFRGTARPYLNQVETTTDYHIQSASLWADQITAVYLSPQDPNYFKARETPVALYRYRLEFTHLPMRSAIATPTS